VRDLASVFEILGERISQFSVSRLEAEIAWHDCML
jgi:hypothetical protein